MYSFCENWTWACQYPKIAVYRMGVHWLETTSSSCTRWLRPTFCACGENFDDFPCEKSSTISTWTLEPYFSPYRLHQHGIKDLGNVLDLPDQCVTKVGYQGSVDTITYILDGGASPHADRISQVGMSASLLRIYFHQAKVVPYAVDEIVQAVCGQSTSDELGATARSLQVHLTADHDGVVIVGQLVHPFQANCVYLVVHVCPQDVRSDHKS